MEEPKGLGGWLAERCQQESLSLRQAAIKTGISHATVADIIKGGRPSPQTVKKLAGAFASNGDNAKMALEDELLVLAGYRSYRPEVQFTLPMAQLLDKLSKFNGRQLKVMGHFADFVAGLEKKRR